MGGCGCGEMNIIDSFLVGDKVIAVDLYKGCPYCGADIGVRLHIFTKKEAKYWDIKPKEKFEPDKFNPSIRDIFWLGVDDIRKAIGDLSNPEDFQWYEDVDDFLVEYGYEILQKALEDR